MAITLQATLSKKLPIPGENFSSKQASITISAEVGSYDQVANEAHRLYVLAEAAVDAQLQQPAQPPQQHIPTPQQSSQPRSPANGSRPYTGQRRGPAPVTDSQLRFLGKLIEQTHASIPAILQQYQIGNLRDLSCKDAVRLIDELKSQGSSR